MNFNENIKMTEKIVKNINKLFQDQTINVTLSY